MTDFNT